MFIVDGVESAFDGCPAVVRLRYCSGGVSMTILVTIDEAQKLASSLLSKIDWFEKLMAEE